MRTALLISLLVACSTPPLNLAPTDSGAADASTADAAQRPRFCGPNSASYLQANTCAQTCAPDYQLFFFCTEKLGKLAYTAAPVQHLVTFGFSWELGNRECQRFPVKIWSLKPTAKPSAAETGKHTISSVDSDCEKLPLQQPFLSDTNFQFYTPTEIAQ